MAHWSTYRPAVFPAPWFPRQSLQGSPETWLLVVSKKPWRSYEANEIPLGWHLFVHTTEDWSAKDSAGWGLPIKTEDLGIYRTVDETAGAVKAELALMHFGTVEDNPDYGKPPAPWSEIPSERRSIPSSRREWAWYPEGRARVRPARGYGGARTTVRRGRNPRRYRLAASVGLDNQTVSYTLYLITGRGRKEFLSSSKVMVALLDEAKADWSLRQFGGVG